MITNPLTKEAMKEIIETLIERGWKQPIATQGYYLYPTGYSELDQTHYSLADIINDNEAMRLLFGEVDMNKVDPGSAYIIIDYRWYQQTLITMDTEEQQITYIKKHMK